MEIAQPEAASSQRTLDDGRVELTDTSSIEGSPYYNSELAPTPIERRTWNTYNYAALWIGMAFCIPSYLLASGLIAIGMNWLQAFLCITLANLIVLVPMLLNSHAGTKFGIPYPVFARAYFGIRGANLAALLRAFVACGWFGIQSWVGGQAMHAILASIVGKSWLEGATFLGHPWTVWVSFAVFWVLQIAIIWRGMEAVRKLESWTAPLMIAGLLALLAWVLVKAGGFGPILAAPSKLGWGTEFWAVFAPSLMGMIAFWATLSLNMPDFTRFGQGQRKQLLGQVIGLPTSMSLIALLSIMITSGSAVVYGKPIWDPVVLITKIPSPLAVIFAMVIVIIATISTNLAANTVSPAYDFSNALPKLISFRTGGLLTGIIGVLMMPWELVSDPSIYIFAWLQFYGGVLSAIAGVLIAGYWLLGKTSVNLTDLYRRNGNYWFSGGWNWQSLVAWGLAAVLAVGGAYDGPFPADGLIPFLKGLYDYNLVVGTVAGLVLYYLLVRLVPPRGAATAPVAVPVEGEASA